MTTTILDEARAASANTTDVRRTIERLTGMGFKNDAFKTLHHLKGTINTFTNYSRGRSFILDGNNHRVHQRLTYVLLSCPAGAPPKGKSFQALAKEAFRLIPPIV
jgi:hypothetical protein